MKNLVAITCVVLMMMMNGVSSNSRRKGCGGKPVDIVFVIDASNNIQPRDFQRQVQFTKSLVSEMDVSHGKTRVGVITFGGEYIHRVLNLDSQNNNKNQLISKISSLYRLHGRSYADRALLHAREMIRRDGRTNVPRIVVMLSNGRSEYPQMTVDEATKTKSADVTILSVAVGRDTNERMLRQIASKKDFVFSADSSSDLSAVRQVLAIGSCEVQGDSPYGYHGSSSRRRYDPYHYENSVLKQDKTKKLAKSCGGRPAEIVFCLDASGSIWGPDFKRQLKFVSDMTSVFQIAPNMTRIGVLTFGDRPKEWFRLGTYNFEEEVTKSISDIYQTRGGTNTAGALSTMRTDFFSPSEVRPDVVKMAIVITDGKSSNRSETARQAALLREEGIYVFGIGVGTSLDEKELHLIAGQPSKDYVFFVNNYKALDKIKNILSLKACQVTLPPTTEAPITECGERRPADVVFAMPPDANAAQAAKVLEMMSKAADALKMGDNGVRIGMVPKECVSLPGMDLAGDLDTSILEEQLNQGFQAAHTPKVIKYMRKTSFTKDRGARPNAQKMAIIVLDKASPNFQFAAAEAAKARKLGVEIFIVAVGDDITDEELKYVASSPVEDHVIRVQDYSELPGIASDLVDMINKACIEFVPEEQLQIEEESEEKNERDFNRINIFNRFSTS